MTRLSVNINKIATIRNARGGNLPDLLLFAADCERFGAQGITVHPRPDERHIRYQDVIDLKPLVKTEFNIEGYPSEKFIGLVRLVKPHQVTLVPDPPDAITSNSGWNIKEHFKFLEKVISQFKQDNIRVSLFVDTDVHNIADAASTGADRVELFTENYAKTFPGDPEKAIAPYHEAAVAAMKAGIGINAGHDLNLENIAYFVKNIPGLLEVSIGHALVCEALYLGIENTIQLYLGKMKG